MMLGIMKMNGTQPSNQTAREYFGWTKIDDLELATVQIDQRNRKLREAIANDCSLREEMELEVQIDAWTRTKEALNTE